MENQSKTVLYSSKTEKLCYAFGGVGANILSTFVSVYLTLYYTDSVGLSAAFAGTMMLVCRVFDGFSDVVMGVIIDKTRSRLGKARAWMLYSTVPLLITFFAMFFIPAGLSDTGKMIWAFVTYFLQTVVFFTANNLAYHTLLLRFSLDSADRNATTALRSIFTMVAVTAMNIATPIALQALGGESRQDAWTKILLVYTLLTAVSLFVTVFGTREKDVTESGSSKENKMSMKKTIRLVLSTKYFYITLLVFLAYYLSNGTVGIGVYYARDILGNMSLQSLVSFIGMIPTFVLAPLMPKFIRKWGKKRTIRYGLILGCIGGIVTLIRPSSIIFYTVGSLIRSVGSVPMAVAIYTLNGDIVDYMDMKYGVRAEGVVTASNNVGQKLGGGLGAAILGWMLALGNYIPNAASQPDSAVTAIIGVAVIIPLAVNILVLLLFHFWDIEKYAPQIQAYLIAKNNGERKDAAE